jgi:hypothetical protein
MEYINTLITHNRLDKYIIMLLLIKGATPQNIYYLFPNVSKSVWCEN